jgi:hypothetical protein
MKKYFPGRGSARFWGGDCQRVPTRFPPVGWGATGLDERGGGGFAPFFRGVSNGENSGCQKRHGRRRGKGIFQEKDDDIYALMQAGKIYQLTAP